MKTMFDVQQTLKQFGIFIYTGNRRADMDLMETEIRELYKSGLISTIVFQQAIQTLRREKNL